MHNSLTHNLLTHNLLTHKLLINQATSGKFEREKFLLPKSITPHKRVDELKKDFKRTRCDVGDEKEGVAGESTRDKRILKRL